MASNLLARASISFEEFLVEAKPVAATLIGDKSREGQARYLMSVAAVACRLVDAPIPEMKDSGQGETPGSFIGFNPGGDPFNVLHSPNSSGPAAR